MSNHNIDKNSPAQDNAESTKSGFGLDTIGLTNLNTVYWNLNIDDLYEEILFRGEGVRSEAGAIIIRSGSKTDYSPNDTFIVKEPMIENKIWWGDNNRPFNPDNFNALSNRIRAFLQKRDLFVQDCYTCADENHRLPVRVITEYAWHSLFARNMFIQPVMEIELKQFVPELTIIDIPSFQAAPEIDGTASDVFSIIDLEQKLCIIGGTGYAGEIRKAVFSYLSYLLPSDNVLTLSCASNSGPNNDTAIYLGSSGSGKTTLATTSARKLIGDDEHGWNDEGIFNLEGGSYPQALSLSPNDVPLIYDSACKFGTVLENVIYKSKTKEIDFDDSSLAENTHAAYPLSFIDNRVLPSTGGHPKNIFILTCDANGVLPPIARLTPQQAIYYFISGYSSIVPGTETDSGKAPEISFNPCFAQSSMLRNPIEYADTLKNKILRYKPKCWLVNTGWIGGKYGKSQRLSIPQTRTLIHAALNGSLDNIGHSTDPVFGFQIPESCQDVPGNLLNPEQSWDNPDEYNQNRRNLASLFIENFKKFSTDLPQEIIEAGPNLTEKVTV